MARRGSSRWPTRTPNWGRSTDNSSGLQMRPRNCRNNSSTSRSRDRWGLSRPMTRNSENWSTRYQGVPLRWTTRRLNRASVTWAPGRRRTHQTWSCRSRLTKSWTSTTSSTRALPGSGTDNRQTVDSNTTSHLQGGIKLLSDQTTIFIRQTEANHRIECLKPKAPMKIHIYKIWVTFKVWAS